MLMPRWGKSMPRSARTRSISRVSACAIVAKTGDNVAVHKKIRVRLRIAASGGEGIHACCKLMLYQIAAAKSMIHVGFSLRCYVPAKAKRPREAALCTTSTRNCRSALTRLETRVALADHEHFAPATHDLAVAMTRLGGFE